MWQQIFKAGRGRGFKETVDILILKLQFKKHFSQLAILKAESKTIQSCLATPSHVVVIFFSKKNHVLSKVTIALILECLFLLCAACVKIFIN